MLARGCSSEVEAGKHLIKNVIKFVIKILKSKTINYSSG